MLAGWYLYERDIILTLFYLQLFWLWHYLNQKEPHAKLLFVYTKALIKNKILQTCYYQNKKFRKIYVLFVTYVLLNKWSLTCYSHVKILCFKILCGKNILLLQVMVKGLASPLRSFYTALMWEMGSWIEHVLLTLLKK